MTRHEHRADQPCPPECAPAQVIRCAQVDVYGTPVQLVFQADLTPIETVAAFLRDLADAGVGERLGDPDGDLYAIADELDPPATLPVDPPAGGPTA